MGPTRSTRMCIRTALKRGGVDIIMGKGADSKAVAVAVAAEGDTMGDVVFKAAGVEAEGGIRIKDTTIKEISRGTIIKAISMIIATTMAKEGATIRGLIRDKVRTKVVGEITILPRGMSRWQMGTILATLSKAIRALTELAHRAILGLVGAMESGSGAGETPSLRAPWTFQVSIKTQRHVCIP